MKARSLAISGAVIALLAACDSDSSKADAATGAGTRCDEPPLPEIVLHAGGGEQAGVHGSYSFFSRELGCGANVDRNAYPDAQTVVHPGDAVTFTFSEGTELVSSERCHPACPPTLRIERVQCPADEIEVALTANEPWTIDLEEGTYVVWVDSQYEQGPWTGGIYVGFGLVVAAGREREVLDEAPAHAMDCYDEDAGDDGTITSPDGG